MEHAETSDTVSTLSRGNENKLWYEGEHDRIVVESLGSSGDGVAHELPYEGLKNVWEALQEDGELRRENTREALGRHRSSVTMALFEQALDLPYEENPIRVIVNE